MIEKTAEQIQEETDAARAEELMKTLTNKDKRAAIRLFDVTLEELDGIDQLVLLAHLADRSRSLEEFDGMPIDELQKVVRGS